MKQKFSRLLTFCLAFIMTFQMGMLSAAEAVSDELPRFTENDLVFSGQTLSNAFLGVGNNSSEVVDGNVRFFTQPGGSNSRQYVHTLDQGVEYEAYSHLVVRLKNTGIGGNAMLRIGSSAGDYYQFNYSAVQGESEYRDMVFSLDTPSSQAGTPGSEIKRMEFFIPAASAGAETYVEYIRLVSKDAPMYTAYLVDENGDKTFCVNEDGTATMHIEVDDRAEQDVDIVTAVYDDNGKMLTASFASDGADENGYTTYTTTVNVPDNARVKTMVWDGKMNSLYRTQEYSGQINTLRSRIREIQTYLEENGENYDAFQVNKMQDYIAQLEGRIFDAYHTQEELLQELAELETAFDEFKSHEKGEQYEYLLADGTEVAEIYLPESSPVAIRGAGADLIGDCLKVTGQEMAVTTDADTSRAIILPITVDMPEYQTLFEAGKLDASAIEGKQDAFMIVPVDRALVIVGANNRGVEYGIYTISEEAFGIDPTYYWTDQQPVEKSRVTLNYTTEAQIPDFKYRGFFINDENYLLYWRDGDTDGQALGAMTAEDTIAAVETMLRLRGNMFSVTSYSGTNPSLTWEAMDYMKEREVLVTGSHMDILLSQYYLDYPEWCQENYGQYITFDYHQNKEIIQDYWRYTVERFRDYPAIWPIGLRGATDSDYEDPIFNEMSLEEQVEFIQGAVDDQLQILTEVLGTSDFLTSYTGRGKLSVYARNGLELPDNCIMVWQDNGSTSIMENALYELDPEQSNGIYYHIAYCDNQYVQWVNPEIIRQEVVKSYDATANEYILYNVGDMREIPLSMYVGMKVAWDTQRWKYDETIEDTCTEDWLRLQYGEQQLEEIKGIYDDYYALERDMRCGPIYEVCLNLMKQAVSPDKDREWFAQQTFVEGGRFQVSPEKMKEKESKWDALLARAQACYEKMPEGSGKKFFYNNMMLHILTSQNMNDYGLHLYAAFQAIGASDQEKTVSELDAALASLQAIDAARIPASQGKWENWFRGDDAGAWRDHGWGFSSKRFEERADTLKARFAQ